MDKIRILLADDHNILGEKVRALLEKQAAFEVIGETGNGRQAIGSERYRLVRIDKSDPLHGVGEFEPMLRLSTLAFHRGDL